MSISTKFAVKCGYLLQIGNIKIKRSKWFCVKGVNVLGEKICLGTFETIKYIEILWEKSNFWIKTIKFRMTFHCDVF